MEFTRTHNVKKSLNLGLSIDNVRHGSLIRARRSLSYTKHGEVATHSKCYYGVIPGDLFVIISDRLREERTDKLNLRIFRYYGKIENFTEENKEAHKKFKGKRLWDITERRFNNYFEIVKL